MTNDELLRKVQELLDNHNEHEEDRRHRHVEDISEMLKKHERKVTDIVSKQPSARDWAYIAYCHRNGFSDVENMKAYVNELFEAIK